MKLQLDDVLTELRTIAKYQHISGFNEYTDTFGGNPAEGARLNSLIDNIKAGHPVEIEAGDLPPFVGKKLRGLYYFEPSTGSIEEIRN